MTSTSRAADAQSATPRHLLTPEERAALLEACKGFERAEPPPPRSGRRAK